MTTRSTFSSAPSRRASLLFVALLVALLPIACIESPPGIDEKGSDKVESAGTGATTPTMNTNDPMPLGGGGASGGATSDDDEEPLPHLGGAPPVDDTYADLERCFYAEQPLTDFGMGGASGNGKSVAVATNPFLGEVLVGGGLTLYTYGGDQPGTCSHPPVSGCEASCAIAWPPFLANPELLGEGLDLEDFGTFQRPDGDYQTTYRGWPLYLYKKDEVAGQVNGQGKGSLWHAASPRITEVMILRDANDQKYLVDHLGFTFYVLADDVIGDADHAPVSRCAGDCRTMFRPYRGTHLSIVTSLNTNDFEVFTSPGIGRQVAYRGQPLYLYAEDEKPFDTSGLGHFEASLSNP